MLANIDELSLKIIRIKSKFKEVARTSRNQKYYSGRVYLPKEYVGKKIHYLTEEEAKDLVDTLMRLKAILEFSNFILNTKNGSRMFNVVSKTWNPITGCTHLCRYCWALRLVQTKLKNSPKYRHGFRPTFHERELKVKFNGGFIFVADMGDMFCNGVPDEWITKVLEHISKFPNTYFLLLTKNPERYKDFIKIMPTNVILGATIETNRDDLYMENQISNAPLPSLRYKAMRDIKWDKKFIAIEPILDFDLEVFTKWIRDINPFLVYIGYDNYNNKLPEPPLTKTLKLKERLSAFTLVVEKTMRPAWYEKTSLLKHKSNSS